VESNSTYQQQPRELADLNLQRFKSEIHATIAESEARLSRKIWDKHFETMKWMFFVFWAATMFSLGVLIVALTKR
jgi:hypothetical protein